MIGLYLCWWLGVRQLKRVAARVASRASPKAARPIMPTYAWRRFAAHTAHRRSPEPVSDVRRSLSAGPKALASAK